jgi:type II restriction/modification system DNA methylase subunit YeeA
VVVWIGNLQWNSKNGYWEWPTPVLQTLHTIECRDAILTYDEQGNPVESEWPEVDVIVGNPPFLGDKRMRRELGDEYVDDLRKLYKGRLPGGADLVTYWFEKARAMIEEDKLKRVGLIATQGIRGGANRKVLDRIKRSGDIFYAQSDRPWILDGAMVHVSMIGFDDGNEQARIVDEQPALAISSNLTGTTDLTVANRLQENLDISFIGPSPHGRFDIPYEVAQQMLISSNASGVPNSNVVRPVVSAIDLGQRPRNIWTIDFGLMSLDEARNYEMPFKYVEQHIYPIRAKNRRPAYAEKWWQYAEPRPGMRATLLNKKRYIATPRVAKHRIFIWLNLNTMANDGTVVFARDDDYFFGIVHSRIHELWARCTGTQLREAESGFRYTPTSTFETFPFPWAPGQEPQDDPRVHAIAEAARQLVQLRDEWLSPPQLLENDGRLKDRTLTNLYNKRPDWLTEAHRKLDQAVLDAYGWPHDLSDDETLSRLLALNLERAAKQGTASVGASTAAEEDE